MRTFVLGLVASVQDGADVALLAEDAELSPQQVADRLKMSRTHIYKLLDKDVIPPHYDGTHRRVYLNDVLVYIENRDAAQRELAEQFAHADRNRAATIEELAARLP